MAFYSRSASGFISFLYFTSFSVYNVVYLGLHTDGCDAVFFLKLLILLLKAFKMFLPDAVL